MSAYSNLAGLFSPQGDQVWDDGIVRWQPIPVATRPHKDDAYLSFGKNCRRYNQLAVTQLTVLWIDMLINHADFISFVKNSTGLSMANPYEMYLLTDCLIAERMHNLTWNPWASQPVVFDQLLEFTTNFMNAFVASSDMIRLKGGVLLNKIINSMSKAADNSKANKPTVFMYSGHNFTVMQLLAARKVFNNAVPPYASMAMVELHEIQGEHVVKFYYKNETTSEPYELFPEGCSSPPCTLYSFKMATADFIPYNWDVECQKIV